MKKHCLYASLCSFFMVTASINNIESSQGFALDIIPIQESEIMQELTIHYLFSHGVVDSHKQAYEYVKSFGNKPYILTHPLITFDYPDVAHNIFKINRLKTSFAQENEINQLANIYFSNNLDKPDKKTVLVGVSRGASVILNFMALYNPHNIAALVLESPFDCIDNVVFNLANQSRFGWIPGFKSNGKKLMSFIFCKYNPQGIRPIDLVQHIQKDVPILLIATTQDILVPVWSTINIYQKLQENGNTNVYLLLIDQGAHAKLITNPKTGILYQNVTHAFYQKFGLPHDQLAAQNGKEILELCKPSMSEIVKFYPKTFQQKMVQSV